MPPVVFTFYRKPASAFIAHIKYGTSALYPFFGL